MYYYGDLDFTVQIYSKVFKIIICGKIKNILRKDSIKNYCTYILHQKKIPIWLVHNIQLEKTKK